MKKIIFSVLGLTMLILRVSAQQSVDSLAQNATHQVIQNVHAKKTNASNNIISDFYQLSLNDVTGTSKALSFGATLNAIHSGLKPNDLDYRPSYFANNFQPVIDLGYKNNFQNINTSVGFKYAFINQTDVKNSHLLDSNAVLQADYEKLAALDKPIRRYLTDQANAPSAPLRLQIKTLSAERQKLTKTDSVRIKQLDVRMAAIRKEIKLNDQLATIQLKTLQDQLTKFENGGDTAKMGKELNEVFEQVAGSNDKAAQAAVDDLKKATTQFNTDVEAASQKIANGWNVSFSPLLIYEITYGGVQGVDLGANGSKGFNLFKNKAYSTQLLLKASYDIGADTVVAKINTSRRILTDQFGFNQVLAASMIKSVSKTDPTPWMELGLTASYNYVFDGLKPKEKNKQPALNLKYGILIGKASWLTVPFTYNFAQKAGMALISLQVNVGDSPFSK